jgi:hypothetical protein
VRDGVRLYPADAYRAFFGVCLAIAVGAAAAAALASETRCRTIGVRRT